MADDLSQARALRAAGLSWAETARRLGTGEYALRAALDPASCPVPGCGRPLAAGRHALLCVDHALSLRPGEFRFLTRAAINAARARDQAERAHLAAQLAGHVSSAVRHICEEAATTTEGQRVS